MEKRKLVFVSNVNEIIAILFQFKSRLKSLTSGKISIECYAEKFAKYGIVIAVTENEKTLGFSAFYCNDKETKCAFLSMIAVDSMSVNKGVGRLLIEKAKSISADAGMNRLKLEVSTSNSNAIAFYKKLGFNLVGAASDDSIFMDINL